MKKEELDHERFIFRIPQMHHMQKGKQNPTAEELKAWWQMSGLPLKKFFNTSGLLYKELKLKDKIPTMTEEEQIELLSTNGMLVKRPLIIGDDFVLVGFKEAEWEKLK